MVGGGGGRKTKKLHLVKKASHKRPYIGFRLCKTSRIGKS